MKNRLLKSSFFIAAIIGLTIVACNKDDDETTTPTPTPTPQPPVDTSAAMLEVHFHPKVGDEGFELNKEYTMVRGGETIRYSFTYAAFYVSEIQMETTADPIAFDSTFLLVKPEMEHYAVDSLPAGDYEALNFSVGVDSAFNHLDPNLWPTNHPLEPKIPSMHWAWNPGYRFLSLEGLYATGTDEDSTFLFHIGLDEYLRGIRLPFDEPKTFQAGQKSIVHMEVDFAKFLDGVDLRTEHFTKSISPEQKPLAEKIVDNIESAFSLE